MTKYQEYLDKYGILSEDLFNEVVNSLPEYDSEDLDFCDCFDSTQDEVSRCIVNAILIRWEPVYAYATNFENKTIELDGVDSLEDLENIKNKFSKWTISNYDDLKNVILEAEEENKKDKEYSEKKHLVDSIIDNISIDELKEIVKKYDKQE